jgi:hypothetical protein
MATESGPRGHRGTGSRPLAACFAARALTASRWASSRSLQGSSARLLQYYCRSTAGLQQRYCTTCRHLVESCRLPLAAAHETVSTPPRRPIVTSTSLRNALLHRDMVVFCSPILCPLAVHLQSSLLPKPGSDVFPSPCLTHTCISRVARPAHWPSGKYWLPRGAWCRPEVGLLSLF